MKKIDVTDRLIRTHILQNRIELQQTWKPVTKKVTRYNNRLVDEVIINRHEINFQTVEQSVTNLFQPHILKGYQAILSSPLIPSTMTNKIWLQGTAQEISQMIGAEYTTRIGQNIEAIQKILQETEVNITQYERMAAQFPSADRLKVVEKCMERGENWKGHTYSYRELDNMNRGMTRYIDNRTLQDKYELQYDQAIENGEEPPRQEKSWIWSHLEKTRHSGMDGETVPIKDPFTVINELNGDTDELMFPGDFNNDTNNCSNICNCQCEVMYQ